MTRRRQAARDAAEEALDTVRIEGLAAAYRRAIKILDDDDAPATAHAALVSSMFRAGGFFAAPKDEPANKEPYEMTSDELQAAIDDLEEQAREFQRPGDLIPVDGPDAEGVKGVFD